MHFDCTQSMDAILKFLIQRVSGLKTSILHPWIECNRNAKFAVTRVHQDSARLGQIAAPGRHVSSSRLQGVPVLAPFPPSGVAAGCPGGPMGGTAPSPGSSAGTRWVIFRVCRCGGKWGRVGPGLGDTFFISFQRPLCQNPSGNAARNRNLGKLRRDLGSPVWVSD